MKHLKSTSLERRLPQEAKGCCSGGTTIYLSGGVIGLIAFGAYALVDTLKESSTCSGNTGDCLVNQLYPSKEDY
ncbi:MAG TPA: hypothetical protein P5277_00995 [Candidatus Paceibacterota bacterium]|nr:hypothetical protein [Candidatus Paceibacterota bacterium]